jgi:hypothetical protein
MRLVSHPNVVDLKAFFYTNGEKARLSWKNEMAADNAERRGLFEFGTGICT